MNRREFLQLSGLVSGSCILNARVSRIIRDICVLNEKAYLCSPSSYSSVLTAVRSSGEFALHLGDPYEEPSPPSWREYLDDRGFDADDPKSLNKWCLEEYDCTQEEVGFRISADNPIEDSIYENWLDGEYTLYDSSLARGYHYLSGLPLSDNSSNSGKSLGDLSFIEGPHPGSNLTYATAPDYATLACLQERLNQLGEGVKIESIED